jgi:hypothetical protein
MKQKNSLILDKEFIQYCELNGIEDIDKLAKETFNRGFTILKYGETPFGKQQIKEVEKIVEVIKEVPIEKIVEIVKEVPVEVIKEVPVEIKGKTKVITKEVIKEVKVQDIEQVKLLQEENEKLKKELENINNSLNKFNKARYMKNSNLGSLYDE